MTTPARAPLPRIGDAERDDAVTLLQEHMAAGRLDQDEFTDRMNTALTARTQADLDPLFADLPGRLPGQQGRERHVRGASTPARPTASSRPTTPVGPRHRQLGLIMAVAAVGIAAIVGFSAAGWQHWWLFVMIPIFLGFGGHRRRGGCGRRR